MLGRPWMHAAALLVVSMLVFVGSPKAARAILFTSASNGNWNLGTTWDQTACAGGCTAGVDYPGSGHTISTAGSHSLTVSGNEVFSGGSFSGGINPFMTFSGGTSSLTLDSGTFSLGVSSTTVVGGNDSAQFINQSTVDLSGSSSFFQDDIEFQNNATLDLTGGGTWNIRSLGGTANLNNNSLVEASSSGGSFVNSGIFNNNIGGIVRADGATLSMGSNFVDNGGTVSAINSGVVRFNVIGGDVTTSATTSFSADGTSEIQLGGDIVALQGSVSGDVNIGNHMISSSGSGYIDLDSQIDWEGHGNISQFRIAAGQTLEFRSPIRFDGTTSYTIMAGAGFTGTLKNAADNTITMENGNTFFMDVGTFENDGLIDVTGGTALNIRGGTFQNDGTYRVRSSNVAWGSNGTGAFENTGTVEVQSGVSFTVAAVTPSTQYFSANTLIDGTWEVEGTLNLDPANAGITTIGGAGGAKVVLIGSTASFAELSIGAAELNTIAASGTFGMHDQQIFTTAGNFTTPGTLEFGLDSDDDLTGLTLTTGLIVSGDPNFTGGTVDIVDLGGLDVGTYRIIEWTGTRTGTLGLGSTPDNGLGYSLSFTDGGSGFYLLEVSSPVPEPGSGLLSILGLVGITRRIRRRRRTD